MLFDTAWPETKTFFPLLFDHLETNSYRNLNILIIGGADGKFVIPLAKFSDKITVLEPDNSCFVDSPDFESLPSKIAKHGLRGVEIYQVDLQNFQTDEKYDLILTSCSWHYSRNKEFGIWNFVDKILAFSRSDTILFLEYMMPSENWHLQEERYLQEQQLTDYISKKEIVQIEYSFYTDKFPEKAHFAVPYDHFHKMGVLMAKVV